MTTINNTSLVTDYSGEAPVVTYSNPVTTVIKHSPPTPIITRIFYNLSCNCCNCCCNCCNDSCCCDEDF